MADSVAGRPRQCTSVVSTVYTQVAATGWCQMTLPGRAGHLCTERPTDTISSFSIHLLKYQIRLLLPTHYSRKNKSVREDETNANTSSDRPTALNATSIQGDRYTPQRYYAH